MVSVRAIDVPRLPAPLGHYSHAVRAGGLLFVSGLLGVRPGEPGDAELNAGEQTTAVLKRLDIILASAALERRDVARLGVLVVDIQAWPAVNAACEAFFGDHRPARTVAPCTGLHYGSLVEMEAIAAFPETSK